MTTIETEIAAILREIQNIKQREIPIVSGSAVTAHNPISTIHSDTDIDSPVSGDIIRANDEVTSQSYVAMTDKTLVSMYWREAAGVANMSHLLLDGGAQGVKLSLAGASETYFQVKGVGGGSNVAYIYGTPTTLNQRDVAGGDAVLALNQEDDSEEMINFIVNGTGSGYPVDTVTAVGSAYARLRVAVNGTFKYIQLYNA